MSRRSTLPCQCGSISLVETARSFTQASGGRLALIRTAGRKPYRARSEGFLLYRTSGAEAGGSIEDLRLATPRIGLPGGARGNPLGSLVLTGNRSRRQAASPA